MEVLLCGGAGLIAWVCAFACLGPGQNTGLGLGARRRRAARAFERLCIWASRARIVGWLASVEAWRSVSDELSRTCGAVGVNVVQPASSAALLVVACFASVVVSVLSWSPFGLVVGMISSVIVVTARHATLARKRRLGLVQEMPGIFRTLAVAIGSGQTMPQAIEHVGSRGRGYATESFSKAALMLRCGSSVEEALASIERELEAPGVGMLTTALRVAHRTGSPLRDLFMRSARLVERTSEFERLLSVKTAQVRLSVRIVCVLPAALVLLLSVISPDFRTGLATPAGVGSILVAAAMDGVALAVVRRLVRGVL